MHIFSNIFKIDRGVRQGCPLSPNIYILAAELLATGTHKKERDVHVYRDLI